MAGRAFRFVGGGAVGGEGRDCDRDRERADNEQNNEFGKSHEIAPPVMSTEIVNSNSPTNQKLYLPSKTPDVISLTSVCGWRNPFFDAKVRTLPLSGGAR